MRNETGDTVRRGLRAAGVAAAFVAVLACGLAGEGSMVPGTTTNRCSADPDCAGGACDEALGICVAPDPPPATVLLRFRYPTSLSTFVREVRSVTLGDGPVSVDLPDPVDVTGAVTTGGTSPRLVGARVTFSRASGIPGEPSEEVVATTATTASADGATFLVSVVPAPYDVFVEPLGADAETYPPLALRANASTPSARRVDVDYAAAGPFRAIEGRVMRSDGEPIPNLSVRAEDVSSGRRISSVATTAALSTAAAPPDPPPPEPGWFRILVPGDTTGFRLVVAPTAGAPTFPKVVVDNLDFEVLDANDDGLLEFDDARAEQPSVVLPPIGSPVRFEGRVEGRSAGLDPAPVAGASLRFVRRLETGTAGITATFEQVATTDEAGRIVEASGTGNAGEGVWLLEGDYAVTVAPPASSELASVFASSLHVVAPSDGDPVQRGQLFTLGDRAVLGGAVRTLRGDAMSGICTIETALEEPAEAMRGADTGTMNAVVTGSTDPWGGFGLLVEPGVHRFVVRPPDGSMFPWRVLRGIPAPDGTNDVALEAPAVLEGDVTVAGAPAASIRVEAFVVPEGETKGIAIGMTETGSSGAFTLLLPASPGTL